MNIIRYVNSHIDTKVNAEGHSKVHGSRNSKLSKFGKSRLLITLITIIALLLSVAGCAGTESTTTVTSTTAPAAETTAAADNETPSSETTEPEETVEEKPAMPRTPLVTNIFTADPSAHVFDGKIYIYGSHDQDELFPNDNDGGSYQMIDYHVLSIESFDKPAVDHGKAFGVEDVPWAEKQLWAPDCAYKNGKYYFYFPAKDPNGVFYIGVAVGDKPEGPFVPEENYIQGSYSMDPAVFIDDDDKAYMVAGGIWGGQLERWQGGTYDENGTAPEGDEPALGPVIAPLNDDMLSLASDLQEIQILDASGQPIKAKDEDKRFFEGAWIHKYNDTYYLSYSTGTTHYLVYATSDNIMGPYTYGGRILEPVVGWTTHHSIVEFEGEWYLFYHDSALSGNDSQRNIKYAPLEYKEDGSIKKVMK